MLSRFVVSQVKNNSFFLLGLMLGLWLALAVVPLGESEEECAVAVATSVAEDEFAPIREERPLGGGGAARSVQRPRYYTTELGMRAPLLAAVLSSEAALGPEGRAAAINDTSAHLQPSLRFFIAASAPAAPGLPNVVGFTDTREMLKPFHALKYLADNYLDEYDFFFLVSDASFINARRLSELVSKLSVSQDVYMGTIADDDSHYCTLEGGILLSNSVLRSIHNELDWCVRNSYSAHHHENIGRCVLHASHQTCTSELQHQTYQSVEDEGLAPPVMLPDAVTAHPIMEPKRFHELHAYVSRVYLERGSAAISQYRLSLQRTARRHPPEYRNASWPRGLRDDPGLAPPQPQNRWDHLRWTAFNATHAFMPDDHLTVGRLTGAMAKAVHLVLEAVQAWALQRWSASEATFVEGAWRWEPATALRYRLLVRLQNEKGSMLRWLEAVKPLGAARLVPVPYVTESARVYLVLGAEAGGGAPEFLDRYEAAALKRNANCALLVVLVRESGHPIEEGDAVREVMRAMAAKYRNAQIDVMDVEMPNTEESGSSRLSLISRVAMDSALRVVPKDALMLLSSPDMDFNEEFLNRVRMNTISGSQWFLPAAFSRYSQYKHPRFVDENGNRPQTNTGRFNRKRRAVLSVYRRDYDAARLTAPPDATVAEVLSKSPLRCINAPEPGLILVPQGPPCGLKGPQTQASEACLRAERDQNFNQLDLGARITLAKLFLEVQAESS